MRNTATGRFYNSKTGEHVNYMAEIKEKLVFVLSIRDSASRMLLDVEGSGKLGWTRQGRVVGSYIYNLQ